MVSKGELRIKKLHYFVYIRELFYLVIYATIIYKVLCIDHHAELQGTGSWSVIT